VPAVRAATPADRDAIAVYLSERLRGGPPARYRRYLDYSWLGDADRPDLGMLVEDNGAVRGFIGAIYSRRRIRGNEVALCHLTSWHVDDDVRLHSLPMLKRLLDRHPHVAATSPAPRVVELLEFFKFKRLDHRKLVIPPLGGVPASPRAWRVRVWDAHDGIERHLDDKQRRVYLDHARYRVAQWVIERGDRRCYAVMARRGRGLQVFADVLHASDPQLFAEAIGLCTVRLVRALGTPLAGIDLRLVPARPPRTAIYDRLRPVLFRSPSLQAGDIDALYSEFVPMYG
jgi:hypothetical protein